MRARLFMLALMNVGGVMTSLYLILWLILRERISLTALFGALMPAVFLPSILCALLAIMLGGWRTLALQMFPVVVFTLMYSTYLLPRTPVTVEGREISFLTF